jgi:Ni,Fe-hydrogenase maturation factor
MVSVGSRSFDHGEELSKEVKAALPVVLARVKELVQNKLYA